MPDTVIPKAPQQAPPQRGLSIWLARTARWLHRSFTRENLIQCCKTLASVVPLTVLIWIYAEREQIRTQPNVSIAIEVRCNDPRRVVSLQKPYPDKLIVADLTGPPSTLDGVVERLERHTGEDPVEIFIDPTLATGMVHSDIDAAQELAKNPIFQGVTISNCQPAKLAVLVDALGEVDVEVKPPPDITNLTGPPVFTPHTVKVRGPQGAIDDLTKQGKLVAIADLSGLDGMNVPGPHDFPVVRISPLDNPALSFSPASVEAAVSVKESDVPGTIRSVPIWVYGPPDIMAKYRVDLGGQAVLTNVKVTGPADKIVLANQPDFLPRPHALLEIKDTDKVGEPLERRVTFDLSGLGLHVSDDISEQPIKFTLEENKGSD
jgi:hypothetical protein